MGLERRRLVLSLVLGASPEAGLGLRKTERAVGHLRSYESPLFVSEKRLRGVHLHRTSGYNQGCMGGFHRCCCLGQGVGGDL